MMASVFDVARYVMECLERQGERQVTTWKLQKLVYYAQAWSLVWDDQQLFPERIEAWENGPVCPSLYATHKELFKISKGQIDGNPDALTANEKETIDVVVGHYGEKTAHYLSALTHTECPWRDAREGVTPGERSNNVITLESMAGYYGGLLEAEASTSVSPAMAAGITSRLWSTEELIAMVDARAKKAGSN